MREVRHIGISIARRPEEVYAFASDPRNMPRWAAGLARSEFTQDGDAWMADAPFGKVRVTFAPRNAFGVLDHDVTLESGLSIHNPMRVLPNEEGSEFVFTLIRQPGMSDEEFANDKAAIEADLRTLKAHASYQGLHEGPWLLFFGNSLDPIGNLRSLANWASGFPHPNAG
jgi:hypothetical protein